MHSSNATLLPGQEAQRIQQFEFVVVTAAVSLYVARRLREEAAALEATLARTDVVPAAVLERDLAGYDWFRHAALPLVVGGLLLLAGWLVFHYLAVPRLRPGPGATRAWLLVGLAVLLLGASVFVHHYFSRYVRFRIDRQGTVIGLRMYAVWGKRAVLSEAVGVAILVGLYEGAARFYEYLLGQLGAEYGRPARYASYLLLAGLGGVVLALAAWVRLPVFVWQTRGAYLLLAGGLALQVYLLQHYLYAFWPAGQAPLARPFVVRLLTGLL
ncbi:MAG TPA: hypothetical protein VF646_00860, partial [Cytophagales bacterium]